MIAKRKSDYLYWEYKGKKYIFSKLERDSFLLELENLELDKDLYDLLFARGDLIKNTEFAMDSLEYDNQNEWYNGVVERNLLEIREKEEQIKAIHLDKIKTLGFYHPTYDSVDLKVEKQNDFICFSCLNIIPAKEVKKIIDLESECINLEGIDIAHEKYDGLCPICNEKHVMYFSNIYVVKGNNFFEKAEKYIDEEDYPNAITFLYKAIDEYGKIDSFYKDIYGEGQFEIGECLNKIIRCKNEMEEFDGTDDICKAAKIAFLAADDYNSLLEPSRIVEINMLYMCSKLWDETAVPFDKKEIDDLVDETLIFVERSLMLYKRAMPEHLYEHGKTLDNLVARILLIAATLCEKFDDNGESSSYYATKANSYISNSSYLNDTEKNYYLSDLNYETSLESSNISDEVSSKGCYIATAVYGSYDCPEVWILRRFRDYFLDRYYLGKKFINFYYKHSPNWVKKYGNRRFIFGCAKKILDVICRFLYKIGYSDSFYID